MCRAVSLIVFHGDQDTTVHPQNAKVLMQMHRSLMVGIDDARASATTELGQVVDVIPIPAIAFARAAVRFSANSW
jgi:hypothetical protein